jgi:hypothetical protein
MTSIGVSNLRVGQVLEITFPAFTPRITLKSERELTVEIIAGENVGFTDIFIPARPPHLTPLRRASRSAFRG